MNIYLIRHGETDWNARMKLQGREDIELNSHGVRQAEACGRAFRGFKIDSIVTSPLKRARKTADIISSYLNHVKVSVDDDFTERDFGELSGLTGEEVRKAELSGQNNGVESREALTRRVTEALYRYIDTGNFHNIIIVSHGAAINAVLAELSGHAIGTGKTWLKNACINILHADGHTIEITDYNLSADEFGKHAGTV